MGKGDKRSKRGKRIAGSYGKWRPRTKKNPVYVLNDDDLLVKTKREKTTKKPAKKAAKPAPVSKVEVKEPKAAAKKAKSVIKEEPKVEKKSAQKTTAKKPAKSAGKDDLKKIEGIGPKTSELLVAAGIESFSTLSKTEVDKIKEILAEAGSRYKMIVPDTWPEQASLAAEDKWDELKELQDQLSGGKRK